MIANFFLKRQTQTLYFLMENRLFFIEESRTSLEIMLLNNTLICLGHFLEPPNWIRFAQHTESQSLTLA